MQKIKSQLIRLITLKIFLLVTFLIAIIAIITAAYFFTQYQSAQKLLTSSSGLPAAQVQSIISKVGKLIELPTGEEPNVTTISDTSKLSDKPFFRNAQKGDYLLIYPKSKKAILYRPSTNKIIEVAMITLESEPAEPTRIFRRPTIPALTSIPSPSITPVITSQNSQVLGSSPTPTSTPIPTP